MRALTLCFSASVVLTASIYAYAPVLSLIKSDLNLNYTTAGIVVAVFSIGYAIGQIPWGLLVDRYGGRHIVAASLLGTGATTSLFAFSGSIVVASVLRFASGLFAAGVFVPCIRVVSEWFPQRRRGTALGVLGAGSSLGTVVLGLAMPFAATFAGWRMGLNLFAAFSVVDAALIELFLKNSPLESSKRPQAFRRRVASDIGFWVLGYVQFVRNGVHNALIAWITLFLVEVFSLPLWLAGIALVCASALSMISEPVGSLLSDIVGRIRILSSSLLALAILLTGLALIDNQTILWILLAGIGWFVEFYRGSLFALVSERYGVERTGSVSGAHNTFASAGAFVVSLLYGYVRDLTGTFELGSLMLAVLLLSASLAAVFCRPLNETCDGLDRKKLSHTNSVSNKACQQESVGRDG